MKTLKMFLVVLGVMVSLAFAAATTFEKMVTHRVIKEAIQCLNERLDGEDNFVTREGLPYAGSDCGTRPVYLQELGQSWDYKDANVIDEAARIALSNPRALKILYRVHRGIALVEIKKYEGLAQKLLPHLNDLRKYFVPEGLPPELTKDLQMRRQLNQAWTDAYAKGEGKPEAIEEARQALEIFYKKIDAKGGIPIAVIKKFEWPLRREKEGGEEGKELLAAWAWIVDDFAKALQK